MERKARTAMKIVSFSLAGFIAVLILFPFSVDLAFSFLRSFVYGLSLFGFSYPFSVQKA